jgi:hypothetical protein
MEGKKRKVRIGSIYIFGKEMFNDEASKTIGASLVGPDMRQLTINRRQAKGKLTDTGRTAYDKALAMFREYVGAKEGLKLFVQWDIYCGCSCPCSPGYKISVEYDPAIYILPWEFSIRGMRKESIVDVRVGENGSPYIAPPRNQSVKEFVRKLNKSIA